MQAPEHRLPMIRSVGLDGAVGADPPAAPAAKKVATKSATGTVKDPDGRQGGGGGGGGLSVPKWARDPFHLDRSRRLRRGDPTSNRRRSP